MSYTARLDNEERFWNEEFGESTKVYVTPSNVDIQNIAFNCDGEMRFNDITISV
jgi:hypothetical protein